LVFDQALESPYTDSGPLKGATPAQTAYYFKKDG
jgi:hypothetical protein